MDDGRKGKGRRRLSVDLDTLLMAVDNNSYEITHYLDLDTGEVVPILRETQDELEELLAGLEPGEEISDLDTLAQEAEIPDWTVEAIREAVRVENEYGSRYIPVPLARSQRGLRGYGRFHRVRTR